MLQGPCARGGSFGDEQRQTVEQVVGGARSSGRARCGQCEFRNFTRAAFPGERSGKEHRGDGIEIRIARLRGVDRLQALRGLQQQDRRVAPAVGSERYTSAHDVEVRALGFVQRSTLGDCSQRERVVERAGLSLRFGGNECPARALRRSKRARGSAGTTRERLSTARPI